MESTLRDITCDSDSKIDLLCAGAEIARSLPAPCAQKDEHYYIAVYLVGAYQEILGNLHNLFGDTNAVHITCNDSGGC